MGKPRAGRCGWPLGLAVLLAGGFVISRTPSAAQQSETMEAGSRGFGVPTALDPVLHWIATAVELAGVLAIVIGALCATAIFGYNLWRGNDFSASYHTFRAGLGHGILLGLEFLVAADIIGTVAVEPTFTNLGVLAIIVVIRTFLSFSLEVEINGRWPWQEAPARQGSEPPT